MDVKIRKDRAAAGRYYNAAQTNYMKFSFEPEEEKIFQDISRNTEKRTWGQNAWDGFIENIGRTLVSGHLGDVYKENQEIEAGKKLVEYKKICDRIDHLRRTLGDDSDTAFGDIRKFHPLYNELDQLVAKKEAYDNYFMTPEMANTKIISDMMYSRNNLSTYEQARQYSKYITKPFYSPDDFSTVGSTIGTVIEKALAPLAVAGNAAALLYDEAKELFSNQSQRKRELISAEDDPKILQKMYIGNKPTKDGKEFRLTDEDINYINQRQREREVNIASHTEDLNSRILLYKQGKINLFGEDFKIASPELLSEEYRDQKNKGVHLFDPSSWQFVLPEVGSSVAMLGYSAALLGTDGLIRYAIHEAPGWIGGGWLTKAKNLRAAGKIEEAIKLEQKYAKAAKRINKYLTAADVGQAVAFTKMQRDMETNGEMMDAASERLKELSGWDGFDESRKNNIVGKIKNHLMSMGIDVSDKSDDDLISDAIAYGIKTGDDDIDGYYGYIRKGLNKVINANNALVYADFLETMPYMHFGGGILNKAADRLAHKYLGGTLGDRLFMSAGKKAVQEQAENIVEKNLIGMVAKGTAKTAEDMAAIAKKMPLKTLAHHARTTALNILESSLGEGVEEGVQHKLQEAYKRGDYDNYKNGVDGHLLSIPEVVFDLGMSAESVLDFVGINPGSPENASELLRQSMLIGVLSSMVMMGAQSHVADLFGQGNLSEAIKQSRADAIAAKIVADHYGKVQDSDHIGLFYDGFGKIGVNSRRIANSLENLKRYIDENNNAGVDADFIDKDIRMLNSAYALYKSKEFSKLAKELGIKKGSDDHKTLVTQAVLSVEDINRTADIINEGDNSIRRNRGELRRTLFKILTQDSSIQLDEEEKKYEPLAKLIKRKVLSAGRGASKESILSSKSFKRFVKEYNEKNNTNYTSEELYDFEGVRKAYFDEYESRQLGKIEQTFNDVKYTAQSDEFIKFAYEYNHDHGTQFTPEELYEFEGVRKQFYKSVNKESRTQSLHDFWDRETDSVLDVLYEVYQNKKAIEFANKYKDHAARLKFIRSLTGLDIYTDGLDGIISNIEDIVEQNKKSNEFIYKNTESLLFIESILNNDSVQDVFSIFDNDIEKMFISLGLLESQKHIAQAYIPGDAFNIKNAGRSIFGDSEYSSEFKKVIDQYKEDISKVQQEDLSDHDKSYQENKVIKEHTNKARLALIKDRLKGEKRRMAIAHQMNINDMPFSQALVDTAENGDPVAQKRVEEDRRVTEEAAVEHAALGGERATGVKLDDKIADALDDLLGKTEAQKKKEEEFQKKIEEKQRRRQLEEDAEQHFDNENDATEISDETNDNVEELINKYEEVSDPSEDAEIYDEDPTIDNAARDLEENAIIDPVETDDELAEKYYQVFDYEVTDAIAMELAMMDEYNHMMALDPSERNSALLELDKDAIEFNLLSSTFFYDPKAKDPIKLSIDGKDIVSQLPYELRPGSELAQKLIQENWLTSSKRKCYYIVTRDQKTAETNPNNHELFTVAMIIEDSEDKKCYATTLYRTGVTEDGFDESAKIRAKLRRKGISKDIPTKAIEDEYNRLVQSKYEDFVRSNPKVRISIDKYKRSLPKNIQEQLDVLARKNLAKTNAKILSNTQIDQQIEQLKQTRKLIIDAYLTKDKNGNYLFPAKNGVPTFKKTVTPREFHASNGRINNLPTFRKILNGTVHEIQKAFLNKKLILAYGLGYKGAKPFKIKGFPKVSDLLNLGSAENDNIKGTGLSGKIYMILRTNNGNTVPIMLSERKHNTQHYRSEQGVVYLNNSHSAVLCINPITGEIDTLSDYKPSIAEVLMYLVCKRKISNDLDLSSHALNYIQNLFINSSKKTLLDRHSTIGEFLIFGKKLLWYDAKSDKLFIGIGHNGAILSIDANKLFENTQESHDLRQAIIDHIANNLHMNTDKTVMSQKFDESFQKEMVNMMDQKGVDEILLFDCEEMTFKREDFVHYDKVLNDEVLNEVTVGAWMISSGSLMTDLGETPFVDPFVYASGVNSKTRQKSDEEITISDGVAADAKKPKKKVKSGSPAISNILSSMEEKWEKLKLRHKRLFSKKSLNIGSKRQDILNDLKDDSVLDYLSIYLTDEELQTKNIDAYKQAIANKLKSEEFLRYAEATYGSSDIKIKYGAVSETVLLKNKSDLSKVPIMLIIKKSAPGELTAVFTPMTLGSANSNFASNVTGVFSEKPGSNIINSNDARLFVMDMLGLKEEQVIITNAVMKSCTNKQVFGVTSIATDILGQPFGYIMYNEQYGDIAYHEAWHYVNLLLHDEKTRNKIYDNYRKHNPKYENASASEIEEALADDFKNYLRIKTRKGLLGSIGRMFENIKVFVNKLFNNQKEYRNIYYAIASGKYKGMKLDQNSVQLFHNAIKSGKFASFTVPRIKSKILDNMPHVTTYLEFYKAAYAVVDHMIDVFDITTESDLQSFVNNKNLKEITMDALDQLIDINASNLGARQVLLDFKNNPELLRYLLEQIWKKYGIKLKKYKKKAVDQRDIDAGEKEDDPTNVWDRDDLKVKRKDNASTRTKLFFDRIPVLYISGRDENKNPIYDKELGDYGVTKYYDAHDAWTHIQRECCNIDSYAEKDEKGNYLPTSLLGRVQNLAKSQIFFVSLLKQLEKLQGTEESASDIELLNQIYATINSSKPQILQTHISTPTSFIHSMKITQEEMDSLEDIEDYKALFAKTMRRIRDTRKEFNTRNDNTVSAMNQTPRNWSKNVVSAGEMLDANGAVSEKFAIEISNMLNDVRKTMKIGDRATDQQKVEAIRSARTQLVELYRKLGMDVDETVLDVYLSSLDPLENSNFENLDDVIDAINIVIDQSTKGGSLENISSTLTQTVKSNKDNPSTRGTLSIMGTDKAKPVDEIYSNFFEDKKTGKLSQMQLLAKAHNCVYPSASDFGITSPDGGRIYPISQNNMITDTVRWLNTNLSRTEALLLTPYNRHSVVLRKSYENLTGSGDEIFKIFANVGMSDRDKREGADYISMSPVEDYVQKIMLTQEGYFLSPTMADKKTWYALKMYGHSTISSIITSGHTIAQENEIKQIVIDSCIEETINDINKYAQQNASSTAYEIVNHFKALGNKKIATAMLERISLLDTKMSADKLIEGLQTLELREWAINNVINNKSEEYKYISKKASELAKALAKQSKDKNYLHFDDLCLLTFSDYFLDEIDAVINYYSKENVSRLVNNPTQRKDNFDGKVKNGKLLFGGNGGKFRYFLDISNHLGVTGVNLNQLLEVLYEALQRIMKSEAKDVNSTSELVNIINVAVLDELKQSDQDSLDGFELIRWFLKDLKHYHFGKGQKPVASQQLREEINRILIDRVEEELLVLTGDSVRSSDFKMVQKGAYGYENVAIPDLLLNDAIAKLQEYYKILNSKPESATEDIRQQAVYMVIANHVANTIQSVLEFEKLFSGDPAYYQWNPAKKDKVTGEDPGHMSVDINIPLKIGETLNVINVKTLVENVVDRYSDKIKRLGSLLSPGEEIKTDYTEKELKEHGFILGCKEYTNLNVSDIHATTLFKDSMLHKFKILLLYDHLINTPETEAYKQVEQKYKDIRNKRSELSKKSGNESLAAFDKFRFLDRMYNDPDLYDKLWNTLSEPSKLALSTQLNQSIDAFINDNINVADAQVIIRPEMYRKIRVGLGQWSFKEDIRGYSDELAYNIITGARTGKLSHLEYLCNILETEGATEEEIAEFKNDFAENPSCAWLHNHILAAKVRAFEMYPLKMSYFLNEPNSDDMETVPILNKMAIFPWFEHNATSELGRKLFDRMNKDGHELDMISFESAVKVGASLTKHSLVNKNASVNNQITSIGDIFDKGNSTSINYETGISSLPKDTDPNNMLPVVVLKVNCIRMQLNTKAHHDNERSIGTQFFKLCFSNIVDGILYGASNGKQDRGKRNGKELKTDIMLYIEAMTKYGQDQIVDQFCTLKNGNIQISHEKIRRWVIECIDNNGLDTQQKEIIEAGGCIESLSSTKLFENNATAKVNSEVVEIHTQGGTAVQQSVFGFFDGYSNKAVSTWRENNYAKYNNGEELKWDSEEGSMEVLLSIKFFKEVVPKKYLGSYAQMRQWLIDNGIIGQKEDVSELSEEDNKLRQLLLTPIENVLGSMSVAAAKWTQTNNIKTIYDAVKHYSKIRSNNVKTEFSKLFESLNIDPATAKLPEQGAIIKKAKPFGMGYRIPTQGMSSIFCMRVADVLPEQSGDLIVVPREFTAQTGSDFDVDKLFLATLSYTTTDDTSVLNTVDFKRLKGESKANKREYLNDFDVVYNEESPNSDKLRKIELQKAIQNSLLLSYMDVVGDIHNFLLSRGSIDTVTEIIKNEILPLVLRKGNSYASSFYELTPTFLAYKKQEFSAGKDGIGAFALNVTNMALTQYAGLTIDFSDVAEYGLGSLTATHGKDGLMISAWLSAMVNAHVDVAKDPYIFDINVNKLTYNMTNFLLRTGNGKASILFLSLPILKKYVSMLSDGKGIYGKNLTGNQEAVYKSTMRSVLYNEYLERCELIMAQCDNVPNDILNFYNYYKNITSKNKKTQNSAKRESNKTYDVLDSKHAELALENVDSVITEDMSNAQKISILRANVFLLLALDAYNRLSKYADAMSQLVLNSRIDTKKFGKNLTEQRVFENKLSLFLYSDFGGVKWLIEGHKELDPSKYDVKDQRHKLAILYNNQYALKTYFKTTFLRDKFDKAVYLNKMILQNQTYTATNVFEKIFNAYFLITKGKLSYDVVELNNAGDPYIKEHVDAFDSMINTETAVEVANAIQTILQYEVLMNTGYDIYRRLQNVKERYDEEYSKDDSRGIIDFTCGGSRTAVANKMKQLTSGNNTLVDRLYDLKTELMSVNSDSATDEIISRSEGLVSEDGTIINDLLKYLVGVKANQKFPIDHLQLTDSAMDVEYDKKQILLSAFGQLLEHNDEKVRLFARDLAFYAYHSQYNQNTMDSFFDLVPVEFRKQYDIAIAKSLKNHKSIYNSICPDASSEAEFISKISQKGGFVDRVIDIIGRNFYKNNRVVPFIRTHNRESDIYKDEVYTATPQGRGELKKIPMFFGIYTTFNSQPYIKNIVIGSTYIYKKIAQINRVHYYKNNKTGKIYERTLPPVSVYATIPTAGLSSTRLKMYEMLADFNYESIYTADYEHQASKKIPERFSVSLIKKNVIEHIEELNSRMKDGVGTLYELDETFEIDIPRIYRPGNENLYIKDTYRDSQFVDESQDGAITYYKRENYQRTITSIVGKKNKTDIIIDLNKPAFTSNPEYSDRSYLITNEDINNNQVVEKMSESLHKRQIFVEDSVLDLADITTSAQGVMKSAALKIGIIGQFEGIETLEQADEYADNLVMQLISQGLLIQNIAFEGGTMTSIALARAIQKYSEYFSKKKPVNGYVVYDKTLFTDEQIREESSMVDQAVLERSGIDEQIAELMNENKLARQSLHKFLKKLKDGNLEAEKRAQKIVEEVEQDIVKSSETVEQNNENNSSPQNTSVDLLSNIINNVDTDADVESSAQDQLANEDANPLAAESSKDSSKTPINKNC